MALACGCCWAADLWGLLVSRRKRRGAERGQARGDTDARASFVSARGKNGDARVVEAGLRNGEELGRVLGLVRGRGKASRREEEREAGLGCLLGRTGRKGNGLG